VAQRIGGTMLRWSSYIADWVTDTFAALPLSR
jgi:hypothetical protein